MQENLKIQFVADYRELFNPNWRYIIYWGGRASGKSFHCALSLLIRCCERKYRVLCCREVQNSIKDSVHKLLKDQIEIYKLPNYSITEDSIKNTSTGSEFFFKGLKSNLTGIKSMEGIDLCWCEEGQSLSSDSLDVLIPTIRKKNSQIIISFNRLKKDDSVYTRFIENPPPKTYSKRLNYDVLEGLKDSAGNNILSDEIKAEIIHCHKTKPELFKHIYLGEPRRANETLIIHTEWFKRYTVEPEYEYRFITGDTAQKTKEANDFSVFCCWGVSKDSRLYLIDLIRGKWEAPELESNAKDFWNKHRTNGNGVLRTFYIEDKVSGTGLIQSLQRKSDIPIEAIVRNKDKYTRCLDILGYIKSGYVYLPESAWFVSDFITECEWFTSDDQHEFDDQVDNLMDACVIGFPGIPEDTSKAVKHTFDKTTGYVDDSEADDDFDIGTFLNISPPNIIRK